MNKREKILFGATALLGTALGISIHEGVKQKKQLDEVNDRSKQLLNKLKSQEAELLQKRGNMHFIKNCLAIIKSFAEDAENSSNKEEYLQNVSRANKNSIRSIELVHPLLEHLTYATHNTSSTLFQELKHLKVFMEFVKIRSVEECHIKYSLHDNVKSYIKHNICCCVLTEILENAFTHSYITDADNTIEIKAKIADDNFLVYTVSNPIYKSKRNKQSSQLGGLGLKNLRERLSLFYQNEFEISCTEDKSRYIFKLIVKLFK